LTLSITVAQVLGERRPAIALSWNGSDAGAQSAHAAELLVAGIRSSQLGQARLLAQSALRREPGNVVALRTLGLIAAASRDEVDAVELFNRAERLSRRDLPTQLWLIEREVARNDVAGALRHYDRALRTSRTAGERLVPILVQASADPAIGRALGNLMTARQDWWRHAAGQVIYGTPNPAALPAFVLALRLNREDEFERSIVAAALRRLTDTGNLRAASRLHTALTGLDGQLRNGDFSPGAGVPPFEWALTDEEGLAGLIRPREGGGDALFLIASNGRGGTVARRLLSLPAGRYRLEATAGDVEGDTISRPLLSLQCADGERSRIAALRFEGSPAQGKRAAVSFQVPSHGCSAQWMALDISAPIDPSPLTPWVDDIRVRSL
jgi:tetratricopeptide (TPR) repeat protein